MVFVPWCSANGYSHSIVVKGVYNILCGIRYGTFHMCYFCVHCYTQITIHCPLFADPIPARPRLRPELRWASPRPFLCVKDVIHSQHSCQPEESHTATQAVPHLLWPQCTPLWYTPSFTCMYMYIYSLYHNESSIWLCMILWAVFQLCLAKCTVIKKAVDIVHVHYIWAQ